MVNVTKSNFLEQSNDLIRHLPTAAFVAIDEEMTGISLPGTKRPAKDDTPSKRYEEIKAVPERYSIIQVGVALFHEDPAYSPRDPNSNEFIVRKYNFYLFPPSSNHYTREVTLNPSSVAFLNQHNMDFDLWTKQGVPFVTSKVADDLMKKHRQQLAKQEKEERSSPQPGYRKRKVELTRPEDISFHARAMASLREWIDSATHNRVAPAPDDDEQEEAPPPMDDNEFLLPRCNAFLRRALYESIETEYPSLLVERGGAEAPNQIRVLRLNPEERLARQARLRREGWEQLIVNEIGFWRVFRALSNACRGILEQNSLALAQNVDDMVDYNLDTACVPAHRQIPLVVHNGLMDLLFLLTHFENHKLPETHQEVKALIHEYFPVIYDTKILSTECSHADIRNDTTVLMPLYQKVVANGSAVCPNIRFDPEQEGADEDDEESGQAHEAEWDAYMTGAIFCSLSKRILNRHASLARACKFYSDDKVGSLLHLLAPMQDQEVRRLFGRNRLFLMLTLYTIDLESPLGDPLSRGMSFDNTFRVAGIDPSVTTRDIVNCLNRINNNERNVNFEIVWVDDTTFMVAARYAEDHDEDEETQQVLDQHGQLILLALRHRFEKETISTLKQYLLEQQQQELEQQVVEQQGGWWPFRMVSTAWSSLVGRKRELESSEEEPWPKRRRVS